MPFLFLCFEILTGNLDCATPRRRPQLRQLQGIQGWYRCSDGWTRSRGTQCVFLRGLLCVIPPDTSLVVYGSENVTSGASSDIRSATRTARNMVQVRASHASGLLVCLISPGSFTAMGLFQTWARLLRHQGYGSELQKTRGNRRRSDKVRSADMPVFSSFCCLSE